MVPLCEYMGSKIERERRIKDGALQNLVKRINPPGQVIKHILENYNRSTILLNLHTEKLNVNIQ